MALTTAAVTGYFVKPDGSVLTDGVVTFTLSTPAISGEYIAASAEVEATTDSNGYFSIQIMPNSAYDYPTAYAVVGYDIDEVRAKRSRGYSVGRIRVPADGGDLADLLPVQSPQVVYKRAGVVRGDTLLWSCTYVDDIGCPVPFVDGATIAVSFKTDYNTYNATTAISDAAGGRFTVTADTENWVPGHYRVGIQITQDGIIKTQRGLLEVHL